MQLDEEALCVAVETALAHLVRVDFDERVVTAFLLHRKLKRSQLSGERSRSCRVRGPVERKRREEFVGDPEDIDRSHLTTKKMPHVPYLPSGELTTV